MRKQVGAVGLYKQKTETQTEKLCHFQQYDHNMFLFTQRGVAAARIQHLSQVWNTVHSNYLCLQKWPTAQAIQGRFLPSPRGNAALTSPACCCHQNTGCIGCWNHTHQAHHPCCLAALPQPSKGENPAACDSALFHGTTDCYCRLRLITSLQPRQLEVEH